MPEHVDDTNPDEYARWIEARDQLVKEFDRRTQTKAPTSK